ncbi:hypothetical protein L1887_14456 [Cichorium endivia]|nr:hypothetical protein L1887_14456 [Cichorium endivia]
MRLTHLCQDLFLIFIFLIARTLCMYTRQGEQSSPLLFDPEIEWTAWKNRVVRRLFNMNSNIVSTEDITDELQGEIVGEQPVAPTVPASTSRTSTSSSGGNATRPPPLQVAPRPNPRIPARVNGQTRGANNNNGVPRQRQPQPLQLPQQQQA